MDSGEPHCGLIIKSQLFVPWSSPTLCARFYLVIISRGKLRSHSCTQTNSPIPERDAVIYEGNEMGGTGRLAKTVAITR